jgi:hypothetical protein
MWTNVVIVALLLGVGAFLGRADWRTPLLTRVRTACGPWVTAAHQAVTHTRLRRVPPPGQPPGTG